MNVAVFGLGFVGLTTAVGFANKNEKMKIFGYEIDKAKIEKLKKNQIPFFEEGLDNGIKNAKNLILTDDIESALEFAQIVFYCIGTPMQQDGSANLCFLLEALKNTATFIKKNPLANPRILVIKSTIPPSSLKEVFLPYMKKFDLEYKKDYILANNPEFLREGFAYSDFLNPDRIVIGGFESDYDILKPKLCALYKNFNAEMIFVNPTTAEFIKYLSNTMLSMMISYANEMSMIAKTISDIEVKKAFEILHLDKRFYGHKANIASYLYPGLGFGGYCLPKDTLALYKKAKDKGFESRLLDEILKINEKVLDFHLKDIQKENKQSKIAVLGLSFKPNSDDVRDSKSAALIKKLLECGFKNIAVFDPMANDSFKQTYTFDVDYYDDLQSILQDCDVFIIATAWGEFKQIYTKIPHKTIYNLRYI